MKRAARPFFCGYKINKCMFYSKDYYGFVYKWTNTINKKVYVGSHHGSIDDGYIGSGVYFRYAYNNNPNNFIREILEYNSLNNQKETRKLEQKYLDTLNFNKSYNISESASGGTYENLTKEQKISRNKKISEYNLGKKLSEEHKKKISEARKGKKHSEETIEKLKLLHLSDRKRAEKKGRKQSDLNEKSVLQIRNSKVLSPKNKQQLAIQYNVSISTINDIVMYRTYKWVGGVSSHN